MINKKSASNKNQFYSKNKIFLFENKTKYNFPRPLLALKLPRGRESVFDKLNMKNTL